MLNTLFSKDILNILDLNNTKIFTNHIKLHNVFKIDMNSRLVYMYLCDDREELVFDSVTDKAITYFIHTSDLTVLRDGVIILEWRADENIARR